MLLVNQLFTLVETHQDFAGIAADKIAEIITNTGKRPCLISLSGGSTPFPVYRKLAKLVSDNGASNRCHWIQTDERVVSAQDTRSNQLGIRQSLLSDGFVPQHSFLPAIPGVLDANSTPAAHELLCQRYFAALMTLPEELRPPAPLDLVILGIGTDGHTASLFPDTDWQSRTSPTGFAVFNSASQPEARLSLTLERIMQAREIIFLVNGSGKHAILQKIFFDSSFVSPATYIARHRGATWVLDTEAAGDKIISMYKTP